MPPLRIAESGRFREPKLFTEREASAPVAKDTGGYGIGYAGAGFGAWGFLPGSTGMAVTPYAAMQIATAWACVKRVAEDMGKLPRQVKRGMQVDLLHPLNRLLREPNAWQSPSQCWSHLIAWYMLRGNAYAVVVRDEAGSPTAIVPISPDRASVMLSPSGQVYYQLSHPMFGAETLRLHRDNVIHIRSAATYDGITGISPIAAAQDVFGLGIATQQHGATLFRQGAQMSGIIYTPKSLNREAKQNLREQFEARQAGVQNAHTTPVFDEGMKFEKLTMTNEDAQFVGSRQFSVEEVARMFGVPPHKVGDLSHAHFNNLEQSELAYRSDTLLPIGTQLREECERVLLFDSERGRISIDVDYEELLRADRKTRYETDKIGIESGRLTQNEARISDGRVPNVPGGDEYLKPMNMGSTRDGTDADTGSGDGGEGNQGE